MARADRMRTAGAIRPVVFDRHNQRVKIYEIGSANEIRESTLIRDAKRQDYTKIVAYVKNADARGWDELGFVEEGTIRGYYADGRDATIRSHFIDPARGRSSLQDDHDHNVEVARRLDASEPVLAGGFSCEVATSADAEPIAVLMQGIFSEYPDPISAEWVIDALEEGTRHFRIVRDAGGRIVASASAEIDLKNRSAELTDCATLPEARGRGLMRVILRALEKDMIGGYGITDLYTLARSDELAMNCAFAKLGWTNTGRLVNNCRMPNGWESMNIWCR